MAQSSGKVLGNHNIKRQSLGGPWSNRIGQVPGILRYIELAVLLVHFIARQDDVCKTWCCVQGNQKTAKQKQKYLGVERQTNGRSYWRIHKGEKVLKTRSVRKSTQKASCQRDECRWQGLQGISQVLRKTVLWVLQAAEARKVPPLSAVREVYIENGPSLQLAL